MGMHTRHNRLYDASQVREIERHAVSVLNIASYSLMQRAALATWRALRQRWPAARRIAVIVGAGNNGGDGYEIARLALAEGCVVTVTAVGECARSGDAVTACEAWGRVGTIHAWSGALPEVDVIVDALFGIGLSRAPQGDAAAAITAINTARGLGVGVVAVDVPSGLDASTGIADGVAVHADLTVTFIADKLGLHTGAGPDCVGTLVVDALEVPGSALEAHSAAAQQMHADDLSAALPRRSRAAYKNRHGHVLVVGGNHGMAGAALLAARAALRAGAGLVSVATRGGHAPTLTAAQPELMCHGVEGARDMAALVARADVIAVGPGLGQDKWARELWSLCLEAGKSLIIDADALNLLAQSPQRVRDAVLTPHPGEAARLLSIDSEAVQRDRVAALNALHGRYGGVFVLKGVGTLVTAAPPWLCPYGNPGMAAAGMGDALTGAIAALRAQGLAAAEAARHGVLMHALAGDRAAQLGERGMIPSDLIDALREVSNPA